MSLNYKQFGKGETIVILHGLLGSLDNWQTLAKKLADQYHVVIVDQRNHGKSPHFDDMDFDLMVSDLEKLMNELDIVQFHLIGHSMGGKAAMNFAVAHPSRIKKLIIVDIGPKPYKGGHDQIFKALFSIDPTLLKSRTEAEEKMGWLLDDKSVLLFLLKNLIRNPEGGYHWKMNLEVIYRNYDNILEEVQVPWPYNQPVLFIRGGKSGYIKDEDMDDISLKFPLTEFVTIENAGHWVHAEAPGIFLKTVQDYLNT